MLPPSGTRTVVERLGENAAPIAGSGDNTAAVGEDGENTSHVYSDPAERLHGKRFAMSKGMEKLVWESDETYNRHVIPLPNTSNIT